MTKRDVEVGDVLETVSGARYRVRAIGSGSWSGLRNYECTSLSGPHRMPVFIYDDEVKRVLPVRVSQSSSAEKESKT